MKLCLSKYIILLIILALGGPLLLSPEYAQADEFLPTTVEVKLECGDGFAEALQGEFCDPGDPEQSIPPDVGTSTCPDFNDIFGNPFASGDLTCNSDCTNYSTSTCYTCGNSYKEQAEECDSSDFGGTSCTTFGYIGGALVCSGQCLISLMNCIPMEEEAGTPGGGAGGGSPGGTSGFSPGLEEEYETKVIIRGKSYPHADVHILIDSKVVGIVGTDAKADFYFETNDITPGVASFGFWSEDNDGLKSTLLTLTFRIISRAVTTITGVYIAPTIEVDKQSVRQGEDIAIYGQTVPETEVHIHINSDEEIIETTKSLDTGNWEIVFDTTPLEVDFHTAKALFQVEAGGNIIKSAFSKSVSFHVGKVGGEAACAGADLNKDGYVNLIDFSILLFYWNTDNECADQDQSGNVDLVDFSIMMFYWTG